MKFAKTPEHQDFYTFLMSKCLVFPVPYVPIHNFFVLHFAFNDYKIAINYHLTRMSKPFDSKASQRQRLANIVLKQEGWDIWDLTEKELSEWHTQEKVDNVKGWLRGAKERQAEKGVIPKEPVQYI